MGRGSSYYLGVLASSNIHVRFIDSKFPMREECEHEWLLLPFDWLATSLGYIWPLALNQLG